MLIIDQDKALIVNFENVNLIGLLAQNDGVVCSRSTNGDTQILGKYRTRERAKEVLQEIVAKYLEHVKTGGRFDYKALTNTTEHYYNLPKVYEMPKE